jgi:hypothetical protein
MLVFEQLLRFFILRWYIWTKTVFPIVIVGLPMTSPYFCGHSRCPPNKKPLRSWEPWWAPHWQRGHKYLALARRVFSCQAYHGQNMVGLWSTPMWILGWGYPNTTDWNKTSKGTIRLSSKSLALCQMRSAQKNSEEIRNEIVSKDSKQIQHVLDLKKTWSFVDLLGWGSPQKRCSKISDRINLTNKIRNNHFLLIKLARSIFVLLKFPILIGHIQSSVQSQLPVEWSVKSQFVSWDLHHDLLISWLSWSIFASPPCSLTMSGLVWLLVQNHYSNTWQTNDHCWLVSKNSRIIWSCWSG